MTSNSIHTACLHAPSVITLHFDKRTTREHYSEEPTALYVDQMLEFHLYINPEPNLHNCSLLLRYSSNNLHGQPASFDSRQMVVLDIIRPNVSDSVDYLIATTIVPPWALQEHSNELYVYLCDFSNPTKPSMTIGRQTLDGTDEPDIPRFSIKPA